MTMQLRNLPAISTLSDSVTICEYNGIKIVRVIHQLAEAGISLHGGHLIWFKPADHKDVIWLSEDAIFTKEKAIRGGVPICWPWFGRIAEPAHGFARTSNWTLSEHKESDNGVIISLTLSHSEESLSVWPHRFLATLNFEITESLKITLDVANCDDHEWRFSGALHTYLNLADIHASTVTGMGPEYIDSFVNETVTTGLSELRINSAIDRVYLRPTPCIKVSDPAYGRTLTVCNQGENSAVIWNPWLEGSTVMADMNNNGYQSMLCVESTLHTNSIEQGKVLQPGEHYQLCTSIGIQ